MKKITSFVLASVFSFLLILPMPVFAQQRLQDLETALTDATRVRNEDLPAALYDAVASFIANRVFQVLIGVAVATAILFMMYGSLQYFTAYGDENRATNAKKTITYAFIGLLIAFMAMGIAGLVQQSIVNKQVLQSNQVIIH